MIIIKDQRGGIIDANIVKPGGKQNNNIYAHCRYNVRHCVGTYPTEERAKEVMGMIEDHIRDSTISKMIAPSAKEISELDESVSDNTIDIMCSLIIFTMPE